MVVELILKEDISLPLDVPYVYVTEEIIKKISDAVSPPDVLALCKMANDNVVLGEKILLLDGIQDPGNLGTIIRSAVAFNVDTICLSPDTVDIYNPKVLRSTQGMIFHTNIIIKSLKEIISMLKEREIPIYGTRVDYGIDVSTLREKIEKICSCYG